MCKKTLLLSAILFVNSVFFSCQKTEELQYSCDPIVDAWVKKNISKIKQMEREEWLNLDEKVKPATLSAFNPIQKQKFWLQKMDEVMSLNWNTEELHYIEIFKQYIIENPNIFESDVTDEVIDEFAIFCYQWSEDVKEKLKWEKELIFAIAVSGNKLLDKTGTLSFSLDHTIVKSSGEVADCQCSTSSDFCLQSHCAVDGCAIRNHGCGWVGVMICDGRCYPEIF